MSKDNSEWVTVPRAPTDAMRDATNNLAFELFCETDGDDRELIYRTMLAAAPAPPADKQDGDARKKFEAYRNGDLRRDDSGCYRVWSVENDWMLWQAALAAKDAAPAPVDGYIANVADHCDRIVWRGSYYHLPIKAAPAPAPDVGDVDQRLTELLLSVINDVQNELGFSDEDKECSNGSAEIVDAIRELKAGVRNAKRYEWLRSLDGSCDAAACVNFNLGFDWQEAHGVELDAAIDAAIAAQSKGDGNG